MRTKTLLLSTVALAAGVIASQAQSNVFSANVVGYATVVYPGNGQYTLLANPFDDGNGNIMSNVMDGANSLPTKSQILTWNQGSQVFATIQKAGASWPTAVSVPPGTGFFVRNGAPGGNAPAVTNTFVGSVVVQNGGSATNSLTLAYTLNGTPIPYAGNLAIAGQSGGDTNMDFGSGLTTKSQILTWTTGSQAYNTTQKAGTLWPATVTIAPTDGFFVNNKSGPATTAVETLNLQ